MAMRGHSFNKCARGLCDRYPAVCDDSFLVFISFVGRHQRLLDEGLTEALLDRLHGPIGLEIGAGTPEEIAMSIMAEIVAVRNQAEKRRINIDL